MSLKDEQLEGAEVLSQGAFKLDRARAIEKMARFQLEDPHRYVLELVAAAVCAGATEITVVNNAADFDVTWDGRHPSADELERLFDHVFSRSRDPAARMLQHLAQGIHGALGLTPRWVRLERPGAVLDFTDPMDVTRAPADRLQDTRVHVKERVRWPVIREWLGSPVREHALLRELARTGDVVLQVNGQVVDERVEPPIGAEVSDAPDTLWLQAGRSSGVAWVRDGVIVARRPLVLGPLTLAGRADADAVELNASRSQVLEDAHAAATQTRVAQAAAQLVLRELPGGRLNAKALRAAALHALTLDIDPGGLADLKLFHDAIGRSYTLATLLATERIYTFTRRGMGVASLKVPQFLEQPADPDARDPLRLQWAALIKRIPDRILQNGDTLLTNLRFGEARRAELRAQGVPLHHTGPRVHQNTFEVRTKWGTVVGTAAFGVTTPGHPERAVAHIRVEGLPLEQRVLELPGPSSVRVECKALTADQRFERVIRDGVYKQVIRVAQDQARQLLLDVAVHHPGHPEVRSALLEWMSDLRAPKKWSAKGVRAVVPPALLDAALFQTLDGAPCSLRDMVHWADDHGQVEHAPPMTLSFDPPPRVVALRNAQAKLLRPLLPRRLRSIERALQDREQREQRLNALPIRPELTEYTVARGPIHAQDFHGQVGFTNHANPATRVRVLKQGVELGQVDVRAGFPGTIACVEWPTVEANGAWTALAHESSAQIALKPRLAEALTDLLPKALAAIRPEVPTLPAWFVALIQEQRRPPHAVDDLPLFKTLGGARKTLGQLGSLTQGGTKRLRYVREAPAVCPPGLEDLVVLDASRSKVYCARWSRQLQDESKRLERLHQARRAFLTRPIQIDRNAPIAWTSVQEHRGEPVHVRVGLSLEAEHTSGLKIFVHHESRLLTTVLQPSSTPYAAVVWGPGVRPSADYTALESGSLEVLTRRVRAVVRDHQRALLTDGMPSDRHTRIRLLLGLTGQTGLKPWEQGARDQLAGLPLFPTAGGSLVSYQDMERAHQAKQLVWVPPAMSDRRPPDERVWLVLYPELLANLRKRFSGLRDGRAELERRAKGRQRRTKLPAVGLSAPGAFLATWTLTGSDRRLFLGCLPAGQRGRIEWLVQDRIIESEPFTGPMALHARVSDPGLQPDDAFEHAHPASLKKAVRAWILEQVPAFMLAVAQVIAAGRANAPASLGAVQRGAMLPIVVRWAASHRLSAAWDQVACVPTTDGAGISLPELKRRGTRGRIRVVTEPLQGQALDQVPVVRADRDLQGALQAYGKLHAYDSDLKQTLRSASRRNAPPVALAPLEHGGVLHTYAVQGEGRGGWLHVLRGGTTRVELTIGGVPLCGFSHAGPVPLFGTISDSNLSADPLWTRPVRDDALTALEAHLKALSERALSDLIQAPPDELDLWLRVIRRALPDAKERRQGTKRPALSALPLFPTGSGRRLSTTELARMGAPRWVSPELAVASPDPERPFVIVPGRLFALAIEVFGGQVATAEAAAAKELQRRLAKDRLPFELQRTVLTSTRVEQDGWRLLVGLVPDLDTEPGHVLVRCQGVPITRRPVPFPGMTGTLEVPSDQVDAHYKVATLNTDQDRALNQAYAELVASQAPTLREGFFSRLRVTRVLGALPRHGGAWRAWAASELFDGPQGGVTLAAVVAAEVVVLGDPGAAPVPDTVVVLPRTSANVALLAAVKVLWLPAAKWLDQQTLAQRESQREARQRNRTRRMTALRGHIDSHLVTLAQGLDVPERAMTEARAVDREEGELLERALEGDAGASWAIAWRRLDRELRALDQWDHAAEVAVRAGEAIAALDDAGA